MTDLPPGLKEFGERLEQAAARQDEALRGAPRRRRRWRNIGLPLLTCFVVAAVSAGAVRLADRSGEPIKPESTETRAPDDPAVVVATRTDDPGGGPPWVVRAYTDAQGRACVKVGRLRDGVFGQVQNGRFRALPRSSPGTCARARAGGPLLAVALSEPVELTIVFGLAVDPTPVTVRVGDRVRRVQPAGLGAFLVLFEGADRRSHVVVTSKVGGRTNVRRLR